jgi:hypothetical protein
MAIEGLANDPLGLHHIARLLAAAALLAFFSGPLARTLVANATPQPCTLAFRAKRNSARECSVAWKAKVEPTTDTAVTPRDSGTERSSHLGPGRTGASNLGAVSPPRIEINQWATMGDKRRPHTTI